jgi:TRAP-type mannitol/chloroaromatic compound transport system permease small subunit
LFKKVIKAIDNVLERASYYGLLVSGVLILIMSWLSTYAVARRYLLHNPEPYSYEIGMSMLLACVVFAIAGLQRQGKHLRVDFITNRFSERTQANLNNILVPVLALVFVSILTWQSWDVAWYSLKIHETSQSVWQEPLFPVKFTVPIGSGLLWLILLATLVRGIYSLFQRNKKMKQ